MYPQTLLSLMSLVLSALAALGTVYLALQVSLLAKTYLREAEANRMERTLQAVQLPSHVAATIDLVIQQHVRGDGDEVASVPDFAADMTIALEHLETFATGVVSGVYDDDIAYSRIGDRLVLFYEISKRFIYESQSKSGSGLYVKLTQLARDWQSRVRHIRFQR